MSESIDFQRRRFFGAAALFAAVEFPQIGLAKAPSAELKHSAGFGPLKQITAGVLSVAYAEVGPAGGPPSSCCTAGPTTSIATPTWRRCSPPRAIA